MLPKLRVSLAAVIATCLAVLAVSAGLLGTRADKNIPGVPEVSRPLVQEAIVAQTESEHFQLLAYSRRADELERLKNLPVAPARAVVVYAEREHAKAAAAAAAPAVGDEVAAVSTAPPPATDAPPAVVAGALAAAVVEPAASIAAGAPTAPSPALAPATTAAAPPPAPAPTTVVKTEDAAATLATGPAQPAPVAAVPSDAPRVATAPSADRVTPDVTSLLDKTLDKPVIATRNPATTARAHTPPPKKKKPRVAHVQRPAPTPSTGFPVDLPDTQTPQPPQPPPRQPSQQRAISLFGGNN